MSVLECVRACVRVCVCVRVCARACDACIGCDVHVLACA